MALDKMRKARVPGPRDHGRHDQRLLDGMLALSRAQVGEFEQALLEASDRLALDYVRDTGERVLIPVTPLPAMPGRGQMSRLGVMLKTLAGAVARIAAHRLDDPALASMLDLSPAELEWLELARNAPGCPSQQVFHRWDLVLDVAGDPSARNVRLFEVNSVDVGGIHYAAATREALLAALEAAGVSGLSLDAAGAGQDPRLVLLDALRAHAGRLRRELNFVAIAENQDFTTGITEAASLVEFFQSQGVAAASVDARAFEVRPRRGICVGGRPVDVIYRNIELRDVAELEAGGADLSALRAAARQGLLLSSPFGELDHKSLWEALQSDEHSVSLTPAERRVVARHVPWTRLLRERRSSDPKRKQVDLANYVRRHRRGLVLKPNRSCGGQGVTIGAITTEADWDRTLDVALAAPSTWVAQELISIPRRHSLATGAGGRYRRDTVYAVYGVFAAAAGIAFVGRASHRPVVNVMQGGGMLAILGREKRKKTDEDGRRTG